MTLIPQGGGVSRSLPRSPPATLFSPQHLELVLGQLQEVVEKHTGQAVLEAASRALHALCDPELALHGRGDLVRSRLADQLADKFHQEVTELLQVEGTGERHRAGDHRERELNIRTWTWDGARVTPEQGLGLQDGNLEPGQGWGQDRDKAL